MAAGCSPRAKDELLPHLENKKVEVFWSDHRLAALWANSDAAKAEFPDYSFLVRGLDRLLLLPLSYSCVAASVDLGAQYCRTGQNARKARGAGGPATHVVVWGRLGLCAVWHNHSSRPSGAPSALFRTRGACLPLFCPMAPHSCTHGAGAPVAHGWLRN